MDCPDPAFDLSDWRDVPVIADRVATAQDLEGCVALFHGGGGSRPVKDLGLPLLADYTDETGKTIKAVIVQVEEGPGFTVAGYVTPDRQNGVALLSEFVVLERAQE